MLRHSRNQLPAGPLAQGLRGRLSQQNIGLRITRTGDWELDLQNGLPSVSSLVHLVLYQVFKRHLPPVPLPAVLPLFATGRLLGWRRKRKAARGGRLIIRGGARECGQGCCLALFEALQLSQRSHRKRITGKNANPFTVPKFKRQYRRCLKRCETISPRPSPLPSLPFK
jgi:hypothetical protein